MYDYCPKCGVAHLCPIDDGSRYACARCRHVFVIIDEALFAGVFEQEPNFLDGLAAQLCEDNGWTETAKTVKAVKP